MDEAEVGVMKEESQENVVRRDGGASGSEFPSVGHDPEGEGVFSCQKCGDAFTEEETYLQHLQQHALEHDGDCRETTDKTEADKSLPHIYSKDGGRNAQTTSKDLSEQTGITSQHAYKCEECGKTYGKFGYFINHQRTHMQPSKSVFHNLEHLEKKSFQCEYCGRSYSRMSALDAHRRCHEGKLVKKEKKCRSSPEALVPEQKAERKHLEADSGRSVTCLCGKKFSTLMKLNTHKRFSHNGQCFDNGVYERRKKGFKCSQCPKSFSSHVALASHEHSHKGKNYKCDECDKTFTTLYFYERHQGLKHSQIIPSKSFLHQVDQVQKKTCECKVCGLKFSRASALHAHELNHLNEMDETKLPQPGMHAQFERKATEQTGIRGFFSPESGTQAIKAEDDETLEPGDLIVKVISSSSSSSESEDNNSDLELVCESDYEIDYGEPGAEERLDCPDCYRCFTNPSSLRVHRMWHDIRRKRHGTQGQSETIEPLDLSSCEDVPLSKNLQEPQIMAIFPHAEKDNNVDIHPSQKDSLDSKKEYNPKKMLLGPKVYHCEQCGKGFWSLGAFSHHKLDPTQCTELRLRKGFGGSFTNGHSRTSFKVACPVCGRKFRHKGIMALHMRKHENGNHKCDICNRSFRLLSGLFRHQAVHNSELLPPPVKSFQYQVEQLQKNTYSCPDCGKRFSRAKALQFHMKSHGYESGYSPPSHRSGDPVEELQCPSCFALFNKKSSLRAHKKRCIKTESSEQPLVKVIKSEDDSVELKENHLENGDGDELKYKCKLCERSFAVIGALNFHKRIHIGSHKALTKAKALVKKSKVEDSGKFSCTDCGRRFVSNSALGTHKRWHRDKPCSKPSQDSEEVSPELKKSDSDSFQCDRCHKTFFNLLVLQRHQALNNCQNYEPEQASPVVVTETFPCTECTQRFETTSLLDDHIKTVHCHLDSSNNSPEEQNSESETFKLSTLPRCYLCSMSFRNIRGLRAHKWQVHSGSRSSDNEMTNPTVLENQRLEERNLVATNTDNPLPTESISIVNTGSSSSFYCKNVYIFKCDNCGKVFSSQQDLGNHRAKARIRPFRCALCCCSFWTERHLQQHFAWHDKIRGSVPNELRLKINKATTASNTHSTDRAGPTGNNPVASDKARSLHECSNCGKDFLTATAVEKHAEFCYANSYHCSSCPSSFDNVEALIEHHQECAATVQKAGVLLKLS
ncbi:unnamed protein product [Knipowitschia caucasica]